MPQSKLTTLDFIRDFIVQDWFASIPIGICMILLIAVVIERTIYYNRNQRNVPYIIKTIQAQLEKNDIDGALNFARNQGGLIGMVLEESLRLISLHSGSFSSAYDLSVSLYMRELEKKLSLLSTIGATCPFLGLFGTVVGVIFTLKLLGEQGSQSAEVVVGVAKALIATGYGLIVAILAVMFNNYFNSIVDRFEQDFQIIKLTFLDYIQTKQK